MIAEPIALIASTRVPTPPPPSLPSTGTGRREQGGQHKHRVHRFIAERDLYKPSRPIKQEEDDMAVPYS